MAAKHKWTEEEDELVRSKIAAARFTQQGIKEASIILGISFGSTYQRSKLLGIGPKPRSSSKSAEDDAMSTDMRRRVDRAKVFSEIIPLAALVESVSVSSRPFPQCCYIVSDGKPFLYCDEPSLPSKSMCETHYRRVFRAPNDWEERLLKDFL